MKNILDISPADKNQSGSIDGSEQWLPAQAFAGKPGMPGTAKGCRLRLEKLAAMHPEIRRKRTGHKGFEYHIRAAGMSLKSERAEQATQSVVSPYGTDEQLNLWVQLFKTMKPHSRDRLLKQALEQVADDLALTQPALPTEVISLAHQLLTFSEEQRKQLLETISK
ncbi:hypothetical protein [Yersinia pseudotuberculosis]|uniref:hypothetical protein n=1 Tax=Yersinia pseudotuberculosis TaxID=633 RepID=UPI0005AD6997|nr:hypothetical protein [Yersinia pseudotuberculosis]AJJ06969.1 hypothetical protein BZ20_1294 [Yersinia pseudotuberculosis]CND36269.1 transposase [Yersinia pseudotuberculosis]CNH93045.1 transposase [Yersinia pseudotuberculosis]